MPTLKIYYQLTKPGIIRGNLITAAAGFLLVQHMHINIGLMASTLAGIALVIASACVFNNYIDRGLDARMDRTKKRALVSGEITARRALIYAAVLGLLGFVDLAVYVNWLTIIIGAVGFIDYVFLYGLAKRRSWHGTLVGSLSGSAPIVAGYTAAANRLDGGALILFLILTFWQMPHFYSIAMYRQDDYASAGLPVLPLVRSARQTKLQIALYIAAFTAACALLTLFGYTGYIYLVVVAALGLAWLRLSLLGFQSKAKRTDERWAKRMFFFSLLVILGTSIMIAVGPRLP